jgi:YD repeat-containing protein
MPIVAIAAAVLVLIPAAAAEPLQTRTFYNERGQEVGRATTRGDTTTFSNERGQVTGRAERRGNATNYYNEKGQMIGTMWRR